MSQLVTGEAVVLQVRIARMPTRALACALDVAIQATVLGTLLAVLTIFLLAEASSALAIAVITIVVVLTMLGYPIVMETLTRGRTIGKMALGLRVVRDDGSSIRFRQALVRALLWLFVDFAPWFACCPGIVASLMNKQGKRFGDMLAGTVVIRERHQPMASPPLFVPSHLVPWAMSLELSRLSDDLANTAREYLARWTELEPMARDALGDAIAVRVGQVTAPAPPTQIPPPAFLSAVLAERRRRELAKLTTTRSPFGAPPTPAPFPVYGAPPVPTQYGAPPTPYGTPSGPPSYDAPTAPPLYGAPPGTPSYGDQPGQVPQYGAPGPTYGGPPAPGTSPYAPSGHPTGDGLRIYRPPASDAQPNGAAAEVDASAPEPREIADPPSDRPSSQT